MARVVWSTPHAAQTSTQASRRGWMELAQHQTTLRGDEDRRRDTITWRWRVCGAFLSCASTLQTLLYYNNQITTLNKGLYVHHTTRQDTSDRLRRSTNSDQIRSESGERHQQTHQPLTIHHRQGAGCWASRSEGWSTRLCHAQLSCASKDQSIQYIYNQAIKPQQG